MHQYEIINDEYNNTEIIKRTDADGREWFIPIDPTNSDYQAYLNRDNPDWGKPQTPQGVNE
jgi:hypothetical protein